MDEITIAEHLAAHETQIKEMDKRLGRCEETNKTLTSLAQSIAKMDITLSNTNDTVRELKDDVHELKDKPAKRLDSTVTAIISAIASGLIGFIIATLL